jgi:hypothetical protein
MINKSFNLPSFHVRILKLNKVACNTTESEFFINILGHDDSTRVIPKPVKIGRTVIDNG